MKPVAVRATALLALCTALLSACGGHVSAGYISPGSHGPDGIDPACQALELATLPTESLSTAEMDAIVSMREEEKLAHDVYRALFDRWPLAVFYNIAYAEQTHADAVLQLIQRYGLDDPSAHTGSGEFTDSRFTQLYDQLTQQGRASLVDALTVGATIEDLDLHDLQDQLDTVVDNRDIAIVWSNLQKGSRNHLRAFAQRLADRGVTYTPQYISQQSYDAIVASPYETGGC